MMTIPLRKIFLPAFVLTTIIAWLVPAITSAQTATSSYVLSETIKYTEPVVRVIEPGSDDVLPMQGLFLLYSLDVTNDLVVSEMVFDVVQANGALDGFEIQDAVLYIDSLGHEASAVTNQKLTFTFDDLVIFAGEEKEFLLEVMVATTEPQTEAIALYSVISADSIIASAPGTGRLRGPIHNVLTDDSVPLYEGGYVDDSGDEGDVAGEDGDGDSGDVSDEEPPVEGGIKLTQDGATVTLSYVFNSSCYQYNVNWDDRARDRERNRERPCREEAVRVSVTHTYKQAGTYRIKARFGRERLHETVVVAADDVRVDESFTAADIKRIIERGKRDRVRYLVLFTNRKPLSVPGCPGLCTDTALLEQFKAIGYIGTLTELRERFGNHHQNSDVLPATQLRNHLLKSLRALLEHQTNEASHLKPSVQTHTAPNQALNYFRLDRTDLIALLRSSLREISMQHTTTVRGDS